MLLDTHAWAWVLTDEDKLSASAKAAISEADAVLVSPVSFYEIGQKVRIGKWPEMAPELANLIDLLIERGSGIAPVSPEVVLLAAALDWDHRDAFDRILAATAIENRLTLVSADAAFDGLNGRGDWRPRVW